MRAADSIWRVNNKVGHLKSIRALLTLKCNTIKSKAHPEIREGVHAPLMDICIYFLGVAALLVGINILFIIELMISSI